MRHEEDQKELKMLAFQAHLSHFEAIRDEINSLNQIQNQLINYSIAIIAGTITLSVLGTPPFLTEQPVALLLISMLMSSISWAFMEAEFRIHDRGRYIEDVLRKKLQQLISHDDQFEYMVLKWESSDITFPRLIIRGMTATGKFAIAYIPSIVSIFVFRLIQSEGTLPWTIPEIVLFWIAVAMAAIFPISLILNVIFVLGYYQTLKPQNKQIL